MRNGTGGRAMRATVALMCAGVLFLAGRAPAQGGGVSAAVEPASPRIGDAITVHLRVPLAAGTTLADRAPRLSDTLASAMHLVGIDSLSPRGAEAVGALHLIALRTGTQHVPAVTVLVRRAGRVDTLASQPLAIDVASVLPDFKQPIKDIAPLARSALGRALVLASRVVALLAAVLVALIVARRLARRPAPEAVPPARVITPRERALAALTETSEQGWWRTHVDRHYETVADVVRQFVAAEHDVPALERTTPELLLLLPAHLDAGRVRELRALLREADFVKFARVRPAAESARAYLDRARALIEHWPGAAPTAPQATHAAR